MNTQKTLIALKTLILLSIVQIVITKKVIITQFDILLGSSLRQQ